MHKILIFSLLFFVSAFPVRALSGEATEAVVLKLLAAVQNLPPDTEFIRNGKSYTKDEAVEHLLLKYNRVKKKIIFPEDFIEKLASKSSISGKDYLIKFPNNKTVKAGDFFREELEKIKGG